MSSGSSTLDTLDDILFRFVSTPDERLEAAVNRVQPKILLMLDISDQVSLKAMEIFSHQNKRQKVMTEQKQPVGELCQIFTTSISAKVLTFTLMYLRTAFERVRAEDAAQLCLLLLVGVSKRSPSLQTSIQQQVGSYLPAQSSSGLTSNYAKQFALEIEKSNDTEIPSGDQMTAMTIEGVSVSLIEACRQALLPAVAKKEVIIKGHSDPYTVECISANPELIPQLLDSTENDDMKEFLKYCVEVLLFCPDRHMYVSSPHPSMREGDQTDYTVIEGEEKKIQLQYGLTDAAYKRASTYQLALPLKKQVGKGSDSVAYSDSRGTEMETAKLHIVKLAKVLALQMTFRVVTQDAREALYSQQSDIHYRYNVSQLQDQGYPLISSGVPQKGGVPVMVALPPPLSSVAWMQLPNYSGNTLVPLLLIAAGTTVDKTAVLAEDLVKRTPDAISAVESLCTLYLQPTGLPIEVKMKILHFLSIQNKRKETLSFAVQLTRAVLTPLPIRPDIAAFTVQTDKLRALGLTLVCQILRAAPYASQLARLVYIMGPPFLQSVDMAMKEATRAKEAERASLALRTITRTGASVVVSQATHVHASSFASPSQQQVTLASTVLTETIAAQLQATTLNALGIAATQSLPNATVVEQVWSTCYKSLANLHSTQALHNSRSSATLVAHQSIETIALLRSNVSNITHAEIALKLQQLAMRNLTHEQASPLQKLICLQTLNHCTPYEHCLARIVCAAYLTDSDTEVAAEAQRGLTLPSVNNLHTFVKETQDKKFVFPTLPQPQVLADTLLHYFDNLKQSILFEQTNVLDIGREEPVPCTLIVTNLLTNTKTPFERLPHATKQALLTLLHCSLEYSTLVDFVQKPKAVQKQLTLRDEGMTYNSAFHPLTKVYTNSVEECFVEKKDKTMCVLLRSIELSFQIAGFAFEKDTLHASRVAQLLKKQAVPSAAEEKLLLASMQVLNQLLLSDSFQQLLAPYAGVFLPLLAVPGLRVATIHILSAVAPYIPVDILSSVVEFSTLALATSQMPIELLQALQSTIKPDPTYVIMPNIVPVHLPGIMALTSCFATQLLFLTGSTKISSLCARVLVWYAVHRPLYITYHQAMHINNTAVVEELIVRIPATPPSITQTIPSPAYVAQCMQYCHIFSEFTDLIAMACATLARMLLSCPLHTILAHCQRDYPYQLTIPMFLTCIVLTLQHVTPLKQPNNTNKNSKDENLVLKQRLLQTNVLLPESLCYLLAHIPIGLDAVQQAYIYPILLAKQKPLASLFFYDIQSLLGQVLLSWVTSSSSSVIELNIHARKAGFGVWVPSNPLKDPAVLVKTGGAYHTISINNGLVVTNQVYIDGQTSMVQIQVPAPKYQNTPTYVMLPPREVDNIVFFASEFTVYAQAAVLQFFLLTVTDLQKGSLSQRSAAITWILFFLSQGHCLLDLADTQLTQTSEHIQVLLTQCLGDSDQYIQEAASHALLHIALAAKDDDGKITVKSPFQAPHLDAKYQTQFHHTIPSRTYPSSSRRHLLVQIYRALGLITNNSAGYFQPSNTLPTNMQALFQSFLDAEHTSEEEQAKKLEFLQEQMQLHQQAQAAQPVSSTTLSNFRDFAVISMEQNHPSLLYNLISLATHHPAWSLPAFQTILTSSSNLFESKDSADSASVANMLPKLFRYTHDPQESVRVSLGRLWQELVPVPAVTLQKHFRSMVTALIQYTEHKSPRVCMSSLSAQSALLHPSIIDIPVFIEKLPDLWALTKMLDHSDPVIRQTAVNFVKIVLKTLENVTETNEEVVPVAIASLSSTLYSAVNVLRMVSLGAIVSLVEAKPQAMVKHIGSLSEMLLQSHLQWDQQIAAQLRSGSSSMLNKLTEAPKEPKPETDKPAQPPTDTPPSQAVEVPGAATVLDTPMLSALLKMIDCLTPENVAPLVTSLSSALTGGTAVLLAGCKCLYALALKANNNPEIKSALNSLVLSLCQQLLTMECANTVYREVAIAYVSLLRLLTPKRIIKALTLLAERLGATVQFETTPAKIVTIALPLEESPLLPVLCLELVKALPANTQQYIHIFAAIFFLRMHSEGGSTNKPSPALPAAFCSGKVTLKSVSPYFPDPLNFPSLAYESLIPEPIVPETLKKSMFTYGNVWLELVGAHGGGILRYHEDITGILQLCLVSGVPYKQTEAALKMQVSMGSVLVGRLPTFGYLDLLIQFYNTFKRTFSGKEAGAQAVAVIVAALHANTAVPMDSTQVMSLYITLCKELNKAVTEANATYFLAICTSLGQVAAVLPALTTLPETAIVVDAVLTYINDSPLSKNVLDTAAVVSPTEERKEDRKEDVTSKKPQVHTKQTSTFLETCCMALARLYPVTALSGTSTDMNITYTGTLLIPAFSKTNEMNDTTTTSTFPCHKNASKLIETGLQTACSTLPLSARRAGLVLILQVLRASGNTLNVPLPQTRQLVQILLSFLCDKNKSSLHFLAIAALYLLQTKEQEYLSIIKKEQKTLKDITDIDAKAIIAMLPLDQ